MLKLLRTKRREKLLKQPYPSHWPELIERAVPHSSLLNDREWELLLDTTRILESEKRFEGCGGLNLTEEMRVTVSAWGALLLVGRSTDYYPLLESILLYPSAFLVPVRQPLTEGAALEGTEVRSGESCGNAGPGSIVLAWDEIQKSSEDFSDGVNVAIHEFAHQLDLEDGAMNGTPGIDDEDLKKRWSEVFSREFDALAAEVARGREDTLIDPYGATSPAEFFSVVTEQFFEWPRDLREEHRELYELLATYYAQDPAQRWDLADST